MAKPLPLSDLPGSDTARRFEGRDHGATVSVFVTRFAPGEGPRLHRHPYDETFLIEEGSATFTVAGEPIEVRAGEMLVAPAETPHKFVSSGDGPLRLISIQPSDHFVQEWLED